MRAFFDIDTQIDFLFPAGALYGPGAERIVPQVARLNRYAAEKGIPLISTTCAHPENSKEFEVWPPHCVVGTIGQQKPAATLLPGRTILPDLSGPQVILEKDDLDLFTNPHMPGVLNKLGIDECVVYGAFTEYCVKCAMMGLLKTGRRVSLVTEATAHLDDAAGDAVVNDFLAAGGSLIRMADAMEAG